MITTNVPKFPHLDTGKAKFYKSDKVRVVTNLKSSYIGKIIEINSDSIVLFVPLYKGDDTTKMVMLYEIEKMRRAEPNETFDTVPYYDAEEKEFWRTHWYTRDGLKEKTPEDIKMLKEFFEKYEK